MTECWEAIMRGPLATGPGAWRDPPGVQNPDAGCHVSLALPDLTL